MDAETGAVVGTRPNIQGRGVSIIGPGCTTTDMCLYSSPYLKVTLFSVPALTTGLLAPATHLTR
ncbi:hypothetical protein [Leifsonia sp. EB41]|uniref:hypothetical protein n=1 Tax=Leifsonia sp. EB41 TaxID=3156260 RepID=UPI003510D723